MTAVLLSIYVVHTVSMSVGSGSPCLLCMALQSLPGAAASETSSDMASVHTVLQVHETMLPPVLEAYGAQGKLRNVDGALSIQGVPRNRPHGRHLLAKCACPGYRRCRASGASFD